jgi:hypothetical protein
MLVSPFVPAAYRRNKMQYVRTYGRVWEVRPTRRHVGGYLRTRTRAGSGARDAVRCALGLLDVVSRRLSNANRWLGELRCGQVNESQVESSFFSLFFCLVRLCSGFALHAPMFSLGRRGVVTKSGPVIAPSERLLIGCQYVTSAPSPTWTRR